MNSRANLPQAALDRRPVRIGEDTPPVVATLKRAVSLGASLGYWSATRVSEWLGHYLGVRTRDECVVLYYHGVREDQRRAFRRQMEWLQANTHVIPLSQVAVPMDCGLRTCITFDDGLLSVSRNVVPTLRALGLPATVFAVSGNLGCTPRWHIAPDSRDRGEVLMTGEELRELPHDLIEIGSHTVTHKSLATLSLRDLRYELVESKRALEAVLETQIHTLSLPYGECHAETIAVARAAGYTTVVTCEPDVASPAKGTMGIGRFKVVPDNWMVEFKLKASGAYRWRNKLPTFRRGVGCSEQRVSA